MLNPFKTARVRTWIAGLARPPAAPTSKGEPGVLAPVDITLDQVGGDPDVTMARRRNENCRSYRLRLQIFLQEEILRREHYERLLQILLNSERRP